ncbi:unnamed protein product, partial [Oikopleura dioica]
SWRDDSGDFLTNGSVIWVVNYLDRVIQQYISFVTIYDKTDNRFFFH